MLVKFAIGHIVDAAPGAAHEDGAQREHRHQMPTRKAVSSHPQGGQSRPQQQKPAGRSVPANQVQVKLDFGGHPRIIHPESSDAQPIADQYSISEFFIESVCKKHYHAKFGTLFQKAALHPVHTTK
jgi:hypothetical protein